MTLDIDGIEKLIAKARETAAPDLKHFRSGGWSSGIGNMLAVEQLSDALEETIAEIRRLERS